MLKSSNMRKTVIKQYTWKSGLIAIHDFKIYDAKAHSVVKNFFTINWNLKKFSEIKCT